MCFCKYITSTCTWGSCPIGQSSSWERLKPPFGSPHFKKRNRWNENCSATRRWKGFLETGSCVLVHIESVRISTVLQDGIFVFLANLGVWFVGDLNHCGTPGFLQSAMRVAQCIAWSRNVGSINNIFCRNTSAKIVQVRCWNPTSCWSTWDEFLPSFWCFIRPSRDVCPWHCGGCASVWSCYNSQVGGSMCWNPLGGVWLLEG